MSIKYRYENGSSKHITTALFAAVERNQPHAILTLLNHRANIDDQDEMGRTQLHYAIKRAHVNMDNLRDLREHIKLKRSLAELDVGE